MTDAAAALNSQYKECYDGELRMLERRRAQDPSLTLQTLESTLKALYTVDGNNWEGRSSVQEQALNAQIDAYEKFIADWKLQNQ